MAQSCCDHSAPASDPRQGAEGTDYICPMHPEVRKKGPGSCPICGMALEPAEVTREAAENPELADFSRRLKLSAALTLPLFLLTMSGFLTDQAILQFLFATPVVLWGGRPFFARGWQSLQTRNLNMFTLIAIGTGV